jgi:hypothetical protein
MEGVIVMLKKYYRIVIWKRLNIHIVYSML